VSSARQEFAGLDRSIAKFGLDGTLKTIRISPIELLQTSGLDKSNAILAAKTGSDLFGLDLPADRAFVFRTMEWSTPYAFPEDQWPLCYRWTLPKTRDLTDQELTLAYSGSGLVLAIKQETQQKRYPFGHPDPPVFFEYSLIGISVLWLLGSIIAFVKFKLWRKRVPMAVPFAVLFGISVSALMLFWSVPNASTMEGAFAPLFLGCGLMGVLSAIGTYVVTSVSLAAFVAAFPSQCTALGDLLTSRRRLDLLYQYLSLGMSIGGVAALLVTGLAFVSGHYKRAGFSSLWVFESGPTAALVTGILMPFCAAGVRTRGTQDSQDMGACYDYRCHLGGRWNPITRNGYWRFSRIDIAGLG
jgi:hypothetical protein